MNGMNAYQAAAANMSPKAQEAFIAQLVQAALGMKKGGLLGTHGLNRTASVPFLSGVPEGKLESAIGQMVNGGSQGLRRLAYSLQMPLKTKLDYVSVDRKCILVDEMPQGDFPIYDVDIPEFGAVKLAALGSPVQFETRIRRVQAPTFVLAIDEPVKYEDISVRRYPAFDRAKERVAIAMAIAEDDEFLRVLAAAAAVSPNAAINGGSSLSKNSLADAVGAITQNQLIAATVLMNPREYADLLKLPQSDIDQVTLNAVVETGYFGSIFGMQLIVSTRVPAGKVYVLTTKDKLGRLPERKKVEVKIFDNVPEAQYDILGWSQLGMLIHNPAGVQVIDVS